jgi:transposase
VDRGQKNTERTLKALLVAKYADHLPLNRQAEIFGRHGVPLARQTLCEWVAAAAAVLMPLYEDLKVAVLTSKVIHTDDTVVPVLDRNRTQTREGRLWVYVGDGRPADLVYDYTADRTRAGPIAFLGAFRGYLQADVYAGYDAVYATGRVVEVACWAHARRYFFDAKASDPARSALSSNPTP